MKRTPKKSRSNKTATADWVTSPGETGSYWEKKIQDLVYDTCAVHFQEDEFEAALAHSEELGVQMQKVLRGIRTRKRLMEIRAAALALKKAHGKRRASKELAALFALLGEPKS